MLNALYKLPKILLASLLIGGGILFILLSDPPHTFCDTQIEHFETIQKGILYKTHDFFKKNRSLCKKEEAPDSCKTMLERKKNLCQKENAPGACYDYFAYLKKLLKDTHVLSQECAPKIYSTRKMKEALSSALTIMVAIAWREEVLTGRVSKYNWLTRADFILFCKIKEIYILYYGKESYHFLENEILSLLPSTKKVASQLKMRRTILSESCTAYR